MLVLLLMLAIGLLCLLDYVKRQYWIKKGVPQLPTVPFLGNMFPILTQQYTIFQMYHKAVHTYQDNKPYVGVYEFWRPTLVIKDQQLVENILVKNFSYFLDHPRWIFDETNFMHGSLFLMTGNKWRAMRYYTIPWFTTGRMKTLYSHVFKSVVIPEGEFEVMPFFRELAANSMAAFLGVQIGDQNEFQENSKRFHDVTTFRYYKLLLVEHFGRLTDSLGIRFLDDKTEHYFRSFIKVALSNKEHSLVQRFQKLLEEKVVKMRRKDLYTNSAGDDELLSFEVSEELFVRITGQFLIGGLDATANSMIWLLYDLALNPEIQKKARDEVRSILKKHDGFTYEAIQEMKYVANCIHESQRIHPTLPFVFRVCTTKYTTPDGLTIDEGTKIMIPSISIHMNPNFYPNPEQYNPERFETIENQTNLKWLPFGEGPRKCAGMRFAQLVMRIMMARLLENHEVEFSENTQHPVINNVQSFFAKPLNKIFFKLNKVA